jgi:hypothetical protein
MRACGQLYVPAALPRNKSPRFPLDRRLVGLRAGLDAVLKRREEKRREEKRREKRSSTRYKPEHTMDVSSQLHAPAA